MRNMRAAAGRPAAVPFNAARPQGVPPATHGLDISVEHTGTNARLCLRGTLDMASAASVYDTIIASASLPVRQLHVDLSGLDAATRAGCRAINVAAKLLHNRGGRLTIIGARPNVKPALTDTGFDILMEFRPGSAPCCVTWRERASTRLNTSDWRAS